VTTSNYLSPEEKQDHVDVITEIGERAIEPSPNKAKLKRLTEGLVSALKVVPDVTAAISAVAPVLHQLHII
jgi:hypothetical protein